MPTSATDSGAEAPQNTVAPLLTLRNLETYYGPIMASRGVSMEVPEGRVVSLLGAILMLLSLSMCSSAVVLLALVFL